MEPQIHTLKEALDNAEIWWYTCFGLACLATVTLIIGFTSVCYWLRRIHRALDRSPVERGVSKAPPLKRP